MPFNTSSISSSLSSPSTKPAFAVVLGSGGVRSIASLGLFEVLQRECLRPDLIVGCSAGAIFGALIAIGHPVAEAVRLATTLWSPEITRQRRWLAIPQMLFPRLGRFDADFGLRHDALMMERLRKAFGQSRLEDLPTPLRVSATDAATGDNVVIRRGPVVDALRASVALPFMFRPGWMAGQRLLDGFISDPLPVEAASDARALLTLGFAAPMPRQIDVPQRMLAQVTSAMTNNLMQARVALARAQGARLVSIVPQLERRVGLFDTEAMPYLVQAGREATEQQLPAIWRLLERGPRLAVG